MIEIQVSNLARSRQDNAVIEMTRCQIEQIKQITRSAKIETMKLQNYF